MVLLLSFYHGDQESAEQWMDWVEELGAGRNHSIILMPGKKVASRERIEEIARKAFAKVDILPDCEGIEGHPQGPNSMMRQAVWHCHTANIGPWMFIEPDCIPLKADAFDQWEREYRAYGKDFMGEFRPASGVTPDYLTGNMMLPGDALFKAPMLGRRGLSQEGVELAFDIVAASQILPRAHLTQLLQQVPKNADGSSHSFPDADSLSRLRYGAMFFHPCKDGSLIERLRSQKSGVRGLNVKCHPEIEVRHGLIGKSVSPDFPKNLRVDISTLTESREAQLLAEIEKLKAMLVTTKSDPMAKARAAKARKAETSRKMKEAWARRKQRNAV